MAHAQPADKALVEGRRIDARLRLGLPARLTLVDRTLPCVLENISQSGARLAVEKPPKAGESGTIQCAGLDLFFDVVWSAAGQIGIAFDEAVSTTTLVCLRQINDRFPELRRREVKSLAREWVTGEPR